MNQYQLSKKQRKQIMLCAVLRVLSILSLLIGADINTTLKALLRFDKKSMEHRMDQQIATNACKAQAKAIVKFVLIYD